MYWLPKLHKTPYKARFIANSSSCTTTELSKLLTSCLTAVKNHVIRYCEKVYERSGKNVFWSIKNSGEVLNKLKSRGFRATSLSTYDFSTLYTTLPHNLIKEKLINLIQWTFKREGSPYIACNEVYISQLIRFARVSSHVVDFNARNKSLTAKLLQQGYRYHKLRKTFSKFYRRHYELVSKFNVGLKTLLHQGLSEPEFYGDLVYKFKKIAGRVDFLDQFRKIIVRYKRIGYNINIKRQSACLVFNPITVNNFASLFNCTPVGRASDSMMALT